MIWYDLPRVTKVGDLVTEIIYFLLDLPGDAFSHKVKAKRMATMSGVKLNPDSDDVRTKFKIIGISVALGLNSIVLFGIFSF